MSSTMMKTMFGFCLVDAQPNEWRQKLKTKTNIRIMNDTKGNSSTNDKEKPLFPYAISYLRFSSEVQGKGDSERRQNTGGIAGLKVGKANLTKTTHE
jgi:hypothetical protein